MAHSGFRKENVVRGAWIIADVFVSDYTPSVLVGHEQQVSARQATQIESGMCIALDFSSVVVHAF
jgi:hypothetical protein